MLTLSEYKDIIDLVYKPRKRVILTESEKSSICDEMLGTLLEERNEIAAFSYPYKIKRDLIWGYLNQRLPNPVSERFWKFRIGYSDRRRKRMASLTSIAWNTEKISPFGRGISRD